MLSFIGEIKNFLNDPFNKYLALALVLLGMFLLFSPSQQEISLPSENGLALNQSSSQPLVIDFFYLPTCPHCAEQKPFNQKIASEFAEVKIVYHDATDPKELELLRKLMQEHNLDSSQLAVPATFFKNKHFIGFESEETTGQEIRKAIAECIKECKNQSPQSTLAESQKELKISLPLFGQINPMHYSLPVLAVVLGLVDGFNPCAMWVLVYLIGLVMNLNDKKKLWIIVGSFVLASAILYFLFMTAWLNAFLLLGYVRAITIIIGLVALGGGILSIKEFITTKGELTCKVTSDEDKKKTMSTVSSIVSSPLTLATIIAIVFLAFAVNSVEFVCSSAIPAIFTQVLALSHLSFFEYYAYILIYIFFFMLDDLVVFGLAAFAVSGGFGEKYAKYCKIIGGVILFVLGILLLFAPQMLR